MTYITDTVTRPVSSTGKYENREISASNNVDDSDD